MPRNFNCVVSPPTMVRYCFCSREAYPQQPLSQLVNPDLYSHSNKLLSGTFPVCCLAPEQSHSCEYLLVLNVDLDIKYPEDGRSEHILWKEIFIVGRFIGVILSLPRVGVAPSKSLTIHK